MTKRERAKAARAMATAIGGVGNEDGESSKTMAMATRMAGKLTATATKRAMATTTRVMGKQRQQ